MAGTRRDTGRWLVVAFCAFVTGVAADALQRDAQAQPGATSSIYVPAGGLVFRAADGTPIARLSRGPHGGSFELYDDRGETREGPSREGPASREVPASELHPNPYTRGEGPGF
jgi:hypothetical protein